MTEIVTTHRHVGNGIAGYGPDGADCAPLLGPREVAEELRWELDGWGEYAYSAAEILAEAGDFEGAWREHKRSEELGTLRRNLSPERESAPLYRDNPARWEATLEVLIADFPRDVSEHHRLYVWECSEEECLPSESDD